MTKAQLITEVQNTLVAHKANKKLTEAIEELLRQYAPTKKSGGGRDKVIEIDGQTFVWCTRHEQYEPAEIFRTKGDKYDPTCLFAAKRWGQYTKEINKAQKALTEAVASGGDIEAAAKDLNALELKRGGKDGYVWEIDAAEFEDALPEGSELTPDDLSQAIFIANRAGE